MLAVKPVISYHAPIRRPSADTAARPGKGVLLCLTLFLLTALVATAQVTGSVSGSVVDAQGRAIPNASISLYRPDGTEPLIQTVASSTGAFSLEAISPQIYKVVIEGPGFAPLEIANVRVSPGVPTVLNNQALQVGVQAAVVEATDQAESVQTTTAQVSTTLTNEQLRNLPQFLRDPLQLIRTQAGVSANRRTFTTINGLRPTYNNVTLEGISIQDNYYRARSLDYLPNRLFIDQISEFTLITSNQSATYGNGATQVAFAVPSGGNAFHGQLFYMASPNNLNANEWFDNATAFRGANPFKNTQAGFNFGGPVMKNRLFFYTNYELLRYRDSVNTYALSPTTATRNDMIPAMREVFATVPLPNIPVDERMGLYRYSAPDRRNRDNVTGKTDYYLSDKHSFSAAYIWGHEELQDLNILATLPVAPIRSDDIRHFATGSWRASLTPTVVNEVRAGVNLAPITYKRVGSTPPYLVFPPTYADLYVGIPYFAGNERRRLVSSTANLFVNDLGSERESRTVNVQDNLTWIKGRHNLSFGFQTQLVSASRTSFEGSVPTYYIDNAIDATVSSVEQRFGLTSPTSKYVLGAPSRYEFDFNNYAGFAQDQVRFSNRLAVTFGLRYDFYTPARERTGLFLSPDLRSANPINTLLSPDAEYRFTSSDLYRSSKNNFAPHIGVALDPFGTGKTVVRAAYSLAYVNDDIIRALEGTLQSNAGVGGFMAAPGGPFVFGDPIPTIVPPERPSAITPRTLAGIYSRGPRQPVSVVDPNLNTPYVQQWSVGIQHSWQNTIFEARYVGNHATGMLREVDLNQLDLRGSGFLADYLSIQSAIISNGTIPSNRLSNYLSDGDLGWFNTPAAAGTRNAFRNNNTGQAAYNVGDAAGYNVFRNPYAQNGATFLGNFSHSTYNAFQFDARHRLRNGFQFQGNYTFSKVLSDSGRTGSTAYEPYRDAFNPQLDRARAPFDLTHAIKANFVYELPFGPGKTFSNVPLKALVAGWTFSGVATWQSGPPFSILSGLATVNRNGLSGLNTADALIGQPAIEAYFGVQRSGAGPSFIPPNARDGKLTDPAAGRLGNLQLRSFSGPWVSNFNLGLQKSTRITERQSLELRFEALNAFNNPSWFVDDQYINSVNFGRILDTFYPSRKVQLAVFYRF